MLCSFQSDQPPKKKQKKMFSQTKKKQVKQFNDENKATANDIASQSKDVATGQSTSTHRRPSSSSTSYQQGLNVLPHESTSCPPVVHQLSTNDVSSRLIDPSSYPMMGDQLDINDSTSISTGDPVNPAFFTSQLHRPNTTVLASQQISTSLMLPLPYLPNQMPYLPSIQQESAVNQTAFADQPSIFKQNNFSANLQQDDLPRGQSLSMFSAGSNQSHGMSTSFNQPQSIFPQADPFQGTFAQMYGLTAAEQFDQLVEEMASGISSYHQPWYCSNANSTSVTNAFPAHADQGGCWPDPHTHVTGQSNITAVDSQLPSNNGSFPYSSVVTNHYQHGPHMMQQDKEAHDPSSQQHVLPYLSPGDAAIMALTAMGEKFPPQLEEHIRRQEELQRSTNQSNSNPPLHVNSMSPEEEPQSLDWDELMKDPGLTDENMRFLQHLRDNPAELAALGAGMPINYTPLQTGPQEEDSNVQPDVPAEEPEAAAPRRNPRRESVPVVNYEEDEEPDDDNDFMSE